MNDLFSRSPVRLAGDQRPKSDATVHAAPLKRIEVDLPSQTVTAYEGNQVFLQCDCVSGDSDHPTPKGKFTISHKQNPCVSLTYHVSMDYAMFFTPDGVALHQYCGPVPWELLKAGKSATDWVGSHGCVRLQESDAKSLFNWVPDPQKTPFHTTVIVRGMEGEVTSGKNLISQGGKHLLGH
jgi:lipoprotein-anchoring transpeptidase ErfK/SrfK